MDALQATLAAEHAAVYVYGLLGSRTSQTASPSCTLALRAAYEAHRDRRDTLIGEIAALAATPTPAAAGVHPARRAGHDRRPLPGGAGAGAGLRVDVRRPRGSHGGSRRLEAIALLNDAAARELSFRGTPEIFPGADEYADR